LARGLPRTAISPNSRKHIGLTVHVGPILLQQGPILACGAKATASQPPPARVALRLFGETRR
jgi:hypothetical protein